MRLRLLVPALLTAFAASTLVAAPASAGGGGPCPLPSAPDPDGLIKGAGPKAGPYSGGGIYALDDDEQSIGFIHRAGRTKKGFVKYRNVSGVAQNIRVHVDFGYDAAQFTVAVTRASDGKDFTSRILGAGKVFKNVAPGGSVELKVFITKKPTAPASARLHTFFHGTDSGLASCGDTVFFRSHPST